MWRIRGFRGTRGARGAEVLEVQNSNPSNPFNPLTMLKRILIISAVLLSITSCDNKQNNDLNTESMFEYDEFNYLTKVYHNETKLIEYVYLYDENIGINTGLVLKEIKNNGEYILYTYRDNFTVDSCSKGIINENGEISHTMYDPQYKAYYKFPVLK